MDTYYHPPDLARFAEVGKDAPELWEKFLGWYNAVFAEGALTEREKALIALAVSHAVQCPYCIDAYTTGSLEKGATPDSKDNFGPSLLSVAKENGNKAIINLLESYGKSS